MQSLRLLGSCDGCPSSAVTLRTTVERAILEAAPEIVIIDVEEPSDARGPRRSCSAPNPVAFDPATGCGAAFADGRRSVVSGPQPLSAVLKRIREMPLQPKPRPGERCELCAG